MHEQLNQIIEILGTISFAMSGSFAAMQKRLDPFGVLIIAFVTSVGGGTVRDLLLDVPVFWMHDFWMCVLIFSTSILAMIFKSLEKKFRVTLFIFRDILLNRIPLIFRREIYATACILGGSTFLLLAKLSVFSYTFIQIFTILLIVVIRTLAVRLQWQMPKFYDRGSENIEA